MGFAQRVIPVRTLTGDHRPKASGISALRIALSVENSVPSSVDRRCGYRSRRTVFEWLCGRLAGRSVVTP
ncbi:hypothetical protein [Natrinema soli]|uniref:Transposase n=1 Tax=Natrinema soli TaxID=1930624 RepID=A0ABD5SS24_9EURY|nr:hypothetical protein [Natrinema soli]